MLDIGKYNKGQVEVKEVPYSFAPDEQDLALIRDKWEEIVAEAKSSGRELWDQEVARYEGHEITPSGMILKVSRMPFSIRYPLRFMVDQIQNDARLEPHGMIVQVLAYTSDGKLVAGVKSQKYFTTLQNVLVGGVYSVEDGQIYDPFKMSEIELGEEIAVNLDDLENMQLIGAHWNEKFNLVLVHLANLHLTSQELLARFNEPEATDGELAELIFLERAEIQDFILNKTEYGQNLLDVMNSNGLL